MEEQSHSESIEELLAGLNHPDPDRRIDVLKSIQPSDVKDPSLLHELRLTANGDPDRKVQVAAKRVLKAAGIKPLRRTRLFSVDVGKGDFWLGVSIWFGLNIFLFFCANAQFSSSEPFIISIPLLLNIGLLLLFAFTRPQIAYGMLAGFGTLLVITLCLGLFLMAACFLPGIISNR